MNTQHLAFTLSATLLSGMAVAQLPKVSYGLVRSTDDPAVIELRIKADQAFSGLYSGSVVTVSRQNGLLQIDSISQPADAMQYHPVSLQGQEDVNIHTRYQKLAGFGMVTLADAGASWSADSQYVIARIHCSGQPLIGYLELSDDIWTQGHNGNHYQELNGEECTAAFFRPRVVLSVDMAEFQAESQANRHALVQWNTRGEYELSHFDVLRSFDMESWIVLETVSGSVYSTSIVSYEHVDADVHPDDRSALTAYYKIRAVDINGNVAEYGPMTVNFSRDPYWDPYSLYPNPAQEQLTVDVPVEWGPLRYEVTTALSQEVVSGKLNAGGGAVDVRSMPSGVIMVHLYDAGGNSVLSRPVMKM